MIRTAALAAFAAAALTGCASSGTATAPAAASSATRVAHYVEIERAAVGGYVARPTLLKMGRTLCSSLRSGTRTFPQLVAAVSQTFGDTGISADNATTVVRTAVVTFCPDQAAQTQ